MNGTNSSDANAEQIRPPFRRAMFIDANAEPNSPSVWRALEFGHFPRRGSVLQPRVAVLGYPGNAGGEFANPNGVVASLQ